MGLRTCRRAGPHLLRSMHVLQRYRALGALIGDPDAFAPGPSAGARPRRGSLSSRTAR